MNIAEATEKIKKGTAAIVRIENKARAEDRELNSEELSLVSELNGAIEAYKMELPEGRPSTVQGIGGRYAETTSGERIRMLAKSEKLASLTPRHDSSEKLWTIADFVRQGMGIKAEGAEAVVSSPATTPLLIGSQIIDDVRAKSRIIQAGAATIPIIGPTNLCRIDGDPTVYQHAQGTEDITPSLPILTPVELDPESLVASVPIGFEVAQDSKNLDAALRTSLAGAFALKLDSLGLAALLANVSIPTSGSGEDCATWGGVMTGVTSALGEDQDLPLSLIASAEDFGARAAELAVDGGQWLGAPPVLRDMLDLPTSSMSEGVALFGNFSAGVAVALRQDLLLELVRFGKPNSASHLLMATMRAQIFCLQPKTLYIQKTSGSCPADS